MLQDSGYVTTDQLVKDLAWDPQRADIALAHLVREGMAWVDEQADDTQYWFPGLFNTLTTDK